MKLFVALLCALGVLVVNLYAASKPNILLIALDDLRDDWQTGMTKPVKAGEM